MKVEALSMCGLVAMGGVVITSCGGTELGGVPRVSVVVMKVEALSMCGLVAIGGVVITLGAGLQVCFACMEAGCIILLVSVDACASMGDYGSEIDIKSREGYLEDVAERNSIDYAYDSSLA
ncbi:hypothetical protein Tco_0922444 [Tanacetum coccineum]|uniref:Uncharacterized protein n=1 Tax=Tanacetum coccineum TaxID=301880 RepID=A0ABQ5CY25_9ASTR